MATKTKKKTESVAKKIASSPYKLILHNDDFNTFDFVIKCLISICAHESEQANQCAHIIHFKGECDVKYGDKEKLDIMRVMLTNSGLSATVEKN